MADISAAHSVRLRARSSFRLSSVLDSGLAEDDVLIPHQSLPTGPGFGGTKAKEGKD